MDLSLVVPCFNEAENIVGFYKCVENCFEGKGFSYEIVFVNDGSVDKTLFKLKELTRNEKGNIQVVSFSRNFGKESAIYAGLSRSKGDAVCIIDADLQQRPEVVLQMKEILDEKPEVDCVAAFQQKRKEGKALSALKSCFYKFINKVSEVNFVNGASDFRLMRRQMVNAVLNMTEYHRFSKGIFSWVGFNTEHIAYEAQPREHGESKWGVIKLTKYAIEGIVAFSTAPLRIATLVGFISSLLSVIYLLIVVVQKLFFEMAVPGYATIVVLILFLGGLILFCLGIIGEYLAKIYVQIKNRPIYIEKEYFTNQAEDK
ncbi:MAG: glycosyltransferase family 2 protein [Clostridia bacterium]|nr:glycosyltransferase family 2 protein [Clostridia bacterium]